MKKGGEMSRLTTVTISGADDGVDPKELVELSKEYCDAMVKLIDDGKSPNASARAALASMAKTIREVL